MASLRLLGGFEVRIDDRVVIDASWPNRKAAALLKFVAVHGRAVHREQAYEALWPGFGPDAAANNLRKCLHQLRATLNAPLLSLQGDMLVVAPDVDLDTQVFRSLAGAAREHKSDRGRYEAALAAYGGDLLPEERYEEWTEPLRSELVELHHQLLLDAALLYESQDAFENAEALLNRLLAEDPTHERAHRALMRVYAAAGQRDRALRQYLECRESLGRDLDADPSAETEALYHEIVNQERPRRALSTTRIRVVADNREDGESSPVVHYATTMDGVRIAYWTMGEGEPLLHLPPIPVSHIELEAHMPELRSWYGALADHNKLIRYDNRCAGLSQRDVGDVSFEAHLRDLEAVADNLGLERFSLLAFYHAGPIAIAYAARHPDRIKGVILWYTYARGPEHARSSQVQARREVLKRDWDLYVETTVRYLYGWSDSAVAGRYADLIKSSVSQDEFERSLEQIDTFDVTPELSNVLSPVLVLQRRDAVPPSMEPAAVLASGLPKSTLKLVEGKAFMPYVENMGETLEAIGEFLNRPQGPSAAADASSPGRLLVRAPIVHHPLPAEGE